MKLLILILTATTTALMAGLFFAWSCSVTLGLARVPDTVYAQAFQSMNRAILNPLFFSCFFGAAILLPLSTYLHYDPSSPARFWFLLAATAAYLIGVMGVTIFGNIPLNNTLEAFDLSSASAQEAAALRARFERPWNTLNNIRTAAAALAIILTIIACIDPPTGGWFTSLSKK